MKRPGITQIEQWLAINVMGHQWWRFHYTRKNGGTGERWQELVPPTETWPRTCKKWGGKVAKEKHPTLEDTTPRNNFRPLDSIIETHKLLSKCIDILPHIEIKCTGNNWVEVWSKGHSTEHESEPRRVSGYGSGKTFNEAVCYYAWDLFRTYERVFGK